MESIQGILGTIFAEMGHKSKWMQTFLREYFVLIFSIQGRVNFENLSRFSRFSECRFRRNFRKSFDWLGFNATLIRKWGHTDEGIQIAVVDCSYIPKSGKNTYGIDHFWSGVANATKRGLEISVLGIIDVLSGKSWALDVKQTPPDLSKKDNPTEEKTRNRMDFYIEQIIGCLSQLPHIVYVVADGFYAKSKIFDALCQKQKHLITKLRPDANLRFPPETEAPKKRGRKPVAGPKVTYDDMKRWQHIGQDEKYEYLSLYSQRLYSPKFKRWLSVVMVINNQNKRYVLLACSDQNLDARSILKYYQLRFQIEFLFRDAKQFAGLTHCQARDKDKLNFHFNASMTAINLVQVMQLADPSITSMNSFVRKAYNLKLVEWLFEQLSSEAKFDLNHPAIRKVIQFGAVA